MFLTKKGLRKIRIFSIIFFVLAAVYLGLVWLTKFFFGEFELWLLLVGVGMIGLGFLVYPFGRYAEGSAKLISSGYKLVRKELKPAKFLEEYNKLRNDPEIIKGKVNFDIMQLVIASYDLLDDNENRLAAAEELIAGTKGKKHTNAKLLKSSLLFDSGKVLEGDELLKEVEQKKLGIMSKDLLDFIKKTDRAMAVGDYAMAEDSFRQHLTRSFPKTDEIGALSAHWNLAKICNLTDREKEAKIHLRYCAENGGETAIKEAALALLENTAE